MGHRRRRRPRRRRYRPTSVDAFALSLSLSLVWHCWARCAFLFLDFIVFTINPGRTAIPRRCPRCESSPRRFSFTGSRPFPKPAQTRSAPASSFSTTSLPAAIRMFCSSRGRKKPTTQRPGRSRAETTTLNSTGTYTRRRSERRAKSSAAYPTSRACEEASSSSGETTTTTNIPCLSSRLYVLSWSARRCSLPPSLPSSLPLFLSSSLPPHPFAYDRSPDGQ